MSDLLIVTLVGHVICDMLCSISGDFFVCVCVCDFYCRVTGL